MDVSKSTLLAAALVAGFLVGLLTRGYRYAAALRRQGQRRRPADPSGPAGDYGDAVVQFKVHVFPAA